MDENYQDVFRYESYSGGEETLYESGIEGDNESSEDESSENEDKYESEVENIDNNENKNKMDEKNEDKIENESQNMKESQESQEIQEIPEIPENPEILENQDSSLSESDTNCGKYETPGIESGEYAPYPNFTEAMISLMFIAVGGQKKLYKILKNIINDERFNPKHFPSYEKLQKNKKVLPLLKIVKHKVLLLFFFLYCQASFFFFRL